MGKTCVPQKKIGGRDPGADSRDDHTSRSSSCPQAPRRQTRPTGKRRRRVEFMQQACWVFYEEEAISRAPVVKMKAIRTDGPGVRMLPGGEEGPLQAMRFRPYKTTFPHHGACRLRGSQCEAAGFSKTSQVKKAVCPAGPVVFPTTTPDSCGKHRQQLATKCSLAKVAPSSTCSLTGSAHTNCATMYPPTVVRAW